MIPETVQVEIGEILTGLYPKNYKDQYFIKGRVISLEVRKADDDKKWAKISVGNNTGEIDVLVFSKAFCENQSEIEQVCIGCVLNISGHVSDGWIYNVDNRLLKHDYNPPRFIATHISLSSKPVFDK